MNKYFLCTFLSLTAFCASCFAQAPQLNSYTDSISDYFITLYINYTSNDTGTIKAQIQLEQGSGNITYDSTYVLPANSSTAALSIGPLYYCASYSSFLFNTSNSHGFSSVQDLFSFNTLCNPNGILQVPDNAFYTFAEGNMLQIHTTELRQATRANIYDLTGRKISSTPLISSEQQIQVNGNAGLYILRVESQGQSLYTNKFVIN